MGSTQKRPHIRFLPCPPISPLLCCASLFAQMVSPHFGICTMWTVFLCWFFCSAPTGNFGLRYKRALMAAVTGLCLAFCTALDPAAFLAEGAHSLRASVIRQRCFSAL